MVVVVSRRGLIKLRKNRGYVTRRIIIMQMTSQQAQSSTYVGAVVVGNPFLLYTTNLLKMVIGHEFSPASGRR